MKWAIVWIPLLGASLATNVFAEGIQITQQSVVLLYEARAEVRAPDHKLAEAISAEYRDSEDEFTRHELMQQIKPIIEKRLREAMETKNVFLLTRAYLGEYDFERRGFPTGLNMDIYWHMRHAAPHDYIVKFKNIGNMLFLPVSVESARALAGDLREGRSVVLTLKGVVLGAREDTIRYRTTKILEVDATRLEVRLEFGSERVVGGMDVASSGLVTEAPAQSVQSENTEPDTQPSCQELEDDCTDGFMVCTINCDRGDETCGAACMDTWRKCRAGIEC